MKNTSALKKKIRIKFKKYITFAMLANIERDYMQAEFLGKDSVSDEVYEKYENLYKTLSTEGKVIDSVLLEKIKSGVIESGGPFAFAKNNDISRHTLFQVLRGKYKSVSPVVKKIAEALGITLILFLMVGGMYEKKETPAVHFKHAPYALTE